MIQLGGGRNGLSNDRLHVGCAECAGRTSRFNRRRGCPRCWDGPRVVRRSIADVTDTDAHAITQRPVITDSNQNVAGVAQLIVEPEDDRADPLLLRHRPNVFDRQVMNVVRSIFGISRNGRGSFARLQTQAHSKDHDARSVIRAPL